MRTKLMSSLIVSSALVLGACAGGYSGQFKGKGTGRSVPASQVKTFASKDAASGAYTELGVAKGKAPTAQEAVDLAKMHCGKNGGNMLIMNTEPFQSGSSYVVDATCATNGAAAAGGASKAAGGGKPAR